MNSSSIHAVGPGTIAENASDTARLSSVELSGTLPPNQSPLRARSFLVKAWYVGEHIHLRSMLPSSRLVSQLPVQLSLGKDAIAFLYRYGSVVIFNADSQSERELIAKVLPYTSHVYERPESEEIHVRIDAHKREGVEEGTLVVNDADPRRLEVIAAALSKSVALAQYEADVAANFDQIEPFALQLESSGRGGRNMRLLLRHIGRALLNEQKMVARVEVTDRPELLWEHPEYLQLYLRLEDEFELRERAAVLDRKLDLISRTVSTVLDLLQKRRSLRVEWYIVCLILLEIFLSVYGMFVSH